MVYRQIVNADSLSTELALPPSFRHKKVVVTIRAVAEKKALPKIRADELDEMAKASAAASLHEALSFLDMTPEQVRAERLSKHGRID